MNCAVPVKTAVLPSFKEIACLLKHPRPALRDIPGHRRAAVALLLAETECGGQILFIERATHPGDPWSGNIAFPGGKVEPDDRDPRHAAERETMEELAIDLSKAEYLGRLSDFDGAHLPVLLSCFVYGVPPALSFELSDEVKDVFWVPVACLMDLERHGQHQFTFSGDQFESPCIRLPVPDKPVLWGLTFRLLLNFLQKTTTFARGAE
jgi:8-oxo-dGTP pyrophosphatase MutT (NUDIX family)